MSGNCEWQNSTTASVASGFSPVTVLKLRKSYADSASLGCPENLNLWKMWVCVHLQGREIGQKSLISLFLELRLGKFNCDPPAICLTKPWDKQLITDVCYIGLNHFGLGIDLPLRWASESVCNGVFWFVQCASDLHTCMYAWHMQSLWGSQCILLMSKRAEVPLLHMAGMCFWYDGSNINTQRT